MKIKKYIDSFSNFLNENYTTDDIDKDINDFDKVNDKDNDIFDAVDTDNEKYITDYINDKKNLNIVNGFGDTLLIFCIRNNKKEIIRKLLKANPPADVHKYSRSGNSAFIEAGGKSDSEILQMLLDAGANINEKTENDDFNCLMSAAASGKYKNVEFLLKKGVNPNIVLQDTTALDWAYEADDKATRVNYLNIDDVIKTIKILKQYGAKTAEEL